MPARFGSGLLALSVVATLAACADPGGQSSPSSSATAVARFDGSYRGALRLTRDGSGRCGAAVIQRELVVRGGQGFMLYNRDENLTAAGPVDADGRFVLVGGRTSPVRIEGQIRDGRASGTFESNNCSYTVELTRQS